MKMLLAIVAVVAILFAVGWMTISSTDNTTTITIETGKIKQGTHEAVQESKEAIEKAKESLK